MTYLVLKAILLWPFSIAVQLLVWLLAPLIAIPYRVDMRLDKAKRVAEANGQDRDKLYLLPREYLLPWLAWAGSDDNAIDEGFYDGYVFTNVAIEDFRRSPGLRYLARVYWILRNPAMGFNRRVIGVPLEKDDIIEEKKGERYTLTRWYRGFRVIAFQLEMNLGFLPFERINWGWKAHRSAPDALMYADRIISLGRED